MYNVWCADYWATWLLGERLLEKDVKVEDHWATKKDYWPKQKRLLGERPLGDRKRSLGDIYIEYRAKDLWATRAKTIERKTIGGQTHKRLLGERLLDDLKRPLNGRNKIIRRKTVGWLTKVLIAADWRERLLGDKLRLLGENWEDYWAKDHCATKSQLANDYWKTFGWKIIGRQKDFSEKWLWVWLPVTSNSVVDGTIEKCYPENMNVAAEILFLDSLEAGIHLGDVLPLGCERVWK